MAAAGINWVFDQTYDEGPKALLEAVQLCYELGMDVNAVNSMGLTALHGAANRGSDDIIRFLVDKGAKLDVKDKEGRTPLTWAEGVFLATHPAKPKPSSIELIKSLGRKMNRGDDHLARCRDVVSGDSLVRIDVRRSTCSDHGRCRTGGAAAQPPSPAILKQYCMTCHNQRLKTAGLELDTLDVDARGAPTRRSGKKSCGRSGRG